MRKTIRIGDGVAEFFGPHDGNVKLLESRLNVQLTVDRDDLQVDGTDQGVHLVEQMIEDFGDLRKSGMKVSDNDLQSAIRMIAEDSKLTLRQLLGEARQIHAGKRAIHARTLNQRVYLDAIEHHDMVFGIGPAGTGKTFLAVSMAVRALSEKKVERIVLTRPAVEAGERLGFLPGTLQEKIDPYLRPLYDALYAMLDIERVERYLERSVIEVAPIAFMRGRTLNDCFVILDEAQNTTPEQMKMFLTRIGFNSKAVITGDITQIDLPFGKRSGLVEASGILDGVDGIAIVRFTDKDVVRHPLVQKIVRAYESHTQAQTARQQDLLFNSTVDDATSG